MHHSRLRVGQGLVGQIAETAEPINTRDASHTRGFRYLPETGEEIFSSFLGVPIQRLGEVLGVLVVQNREPREYTDDEIYALEVVAMVIAEMAELGAFVGPGAMEAPGRTSCRSSSAASSARRASAEGDRGAARAADRGLRPDQRRPRARAAAAARRHRGAARRGRRDAGRRLPDRHAASTATCSTPTGCSPTTRAGCGGWRPSIDTGLAAEVAVEKEQSATRARMSRAADPYLRERLHDLDDLSNRLLRLLTGGEQRSGRELPDDAILVARNIGPGELLDYGRKLRGVVLEEGSVGSHAAIVARALAIPLVIQAARITREAMPGDAILVDGDHGRRAPAPRGDRRQGLPREDGDAARGAGGLCRAARQAGDDARRGDAAPLHERRADGRPARACRNAARSASASSAPSCSS